MKPEAVPPPAPLKVLIVDDDPADRELCRATLCRSRKASFTIEAASTGREALERAQAERWHCVFLDHNLPDSDGVELISDLRHISSDPHLPIIVLTGHGDETLAVRAMQNFASDYIPKSEVSIESLDRAVSNAVVKAELKRSVDSERDKIREMNVELVRKNREIGQFYQSVSHELKTPLTAIREFLSLMIDKVGGEPSADHMEFLNSSLNCCDKLTRLVNDLFDTARVETGKMEIDRKAGDMASIIAEASRILMARYQDTDVDWTFDVASDMAPVLVDRDRIQQVLINLVTNAVKFLPPSNGAVTVRAVDRPTHEDVLVHVQDNGRGIAEDDLPRIFDRLYQTSSDNAAVHHAGMGIGLYLCSSIVALHEGQIWVQSKPGQGSTFTFTVPWAPAAADSA